MKIEEEINNIKERNKRVEQHDKPIKYCIGYINHDFKNDKTTLVKVLSKKCIDTKEKK